MKKIIYAGLSNLTVALVGVAVMIIVSAIFSLIQVYTNINLISFSLWFVIPLGALFIGGIAASGFYYSSVIFNIKANTVFIITVVFCSSLLSIILMYYIDYQFYLSEPFTNTKLAFLRYIEIQITTSGLYIGKLHTGFVTGKVGSIGYVLSSIHFFGFLISSLLVSISMEPYCPECRKYFILKGKKENKFESYKEMRNISESIFSEKIDVSAVENHFAEKKEPEFNGAIYLYTVELLKCMGCGATLLREIAKDKLIGSEPKTMAEFNAEKLLAPNKDGEILQEINSINILKN